QPTEPQDQQGYHHEGIGTPEGQLHDPHTILLGSRKRCNGQRCLHICLPETLCMTSTPQVGYDRCHSILMPLPFRGIAIYLPLRNPSPWSNALLGASIL